jgi:arylsulfatase
MFPRWYPSTRREFLRAGAASAMLTASAQNAKRPNVLIILTDDQGYGDFSCHGNPILKTPNLDKLHAASIRLTDFHVAPMCTPTRGQLMSGVDALKNRACSVTAGRALLRRDLPTMADVFRNSGYRTGIFGKWHLGDNYPYRPMDRGFDEAMYHLGFGMSSAPEFTNDYFNGTYRHNGTPKRFSGYCADFWFAQAMDWMRRNQAAGQPFFCYLPTNTPHGPAWVDEKYSDPYNRPMLPKDFFGMIANLDENMGKLETFLREQGLFDNTLVIFMTDNGATAGFQVWNAGMRGRKTQIHEGGHRVPCFVRWPQGQLRKPADVNVPAQIQDLLPTLIDLCALKKPAKAAFDGSSLARVLQGKAADAGDRMMIVQYGQIPKKFESTVIWGKWRLVNGAELYDIHADPGQEKDVAAAEPSIVAKMRAHYEKWWAGIEPTLKDFLPISIGAAQENPVLLSSSDWEEIYADNPTHVSDAVGGPRGGPWNVYVERSGEYEIQLSRWHPQLNLALTAGREPQKMTKGQLPRGKALPVEGAKLTIAGQSLEARSKNTDTAVPFRVKLAAGTKTKLHGWFIDSDGKDVSGAFYATVRLV